MQQQQQQLLVHQLSPVPPARAANGATHSSAVSTSSSPQPATAAAALASITSSLDSFTEATQQSSQRSTNSHDFADDRRQQQRTEGSKKRNKRGREDTTGDAGTENESAEASAADKAKRHKEGQSLKQGLSRAKQRPMSENEAEMEGEGDAQRDEDEEEEEKEEHAPTSGRHRPPRPWGPISSPLADGELSDGPAATAEELDKLAELNAALADISTSEKPVSLTAMRKRLKVNAALPAQLLAEYKAKGEVSVRAWREMKRQLTDRRKRAHLPAHEDDGEESRSGSEQRDTSKREAGRQRRHQSATDDEMEDEAKVREYDDDSEQDESEEREWDDIIDKLRERDNQKEEKMEQEQLPFSSHDSNGLASAPNTLRRRGASTADRPQQPTAEDEAKLESVNRVMIHLKLSGEKLTQERLRSLLHVSTYTVGPLLAAVDKCGGKLSMTHWMAVKQQATQKRKKQQATRRKDIDNMASLYQVSSRHDSNQLQQDELDAIIASSQADSLNGSQDSTTSRASRLPTGEPQPDELSKVASLNSVMEAVLASGVDLKADELRRRLHVSPHYSGHIEALYRQNGVVTVEDWRAMRRQQSDQRSAEAKWQRQHTAAIEQYKKSAAAIHRPSREERVEQRKREEEAAKEAARLKKQRAEEAARRKVEADAQKQRDKEEKARRKAEAEAQKHAKIEAKLAQQQPRSKPQLDDDGLATESDSDKEEQERLEEERRNKLRRLEEKKMKLLQDEDDEDEEDWMSGRKAKSRKPLSTAKLDKAAAAAAAAAARKEQELQQKVAELNTVMKEWEGSGQQWSRDEMRKRLRVGGDFPTMVLTEWNAKGALSVEAWRSIRKKVSGQRQARRRAAANDSGDQSADKRKPSSPHTAHTTNGTPSHSSHSSSLSSSSSHASTAHKKKLKRTASDSDLSFHHSDPTALPLTNRSLRRRTKVNYTAQLEEDPHTIVELTWYPTKADQPFRIVIDPVVPAVMDVHAHMADVEIIGVLAGQWLADRRLLWVQSAYPCQQVGTDDDLTNVEIDPASLISVQETAEGKGMRLVGWYHSHPYFRNQPSLVDVENQSRYQKMFGETGSKHASSAAKHGMPFIGGIITPYGKGEFKPLPSSIKWSHSHAHTYTDHGATTTATLSVPGVSIALSSHVCHFLCCVVRFYNRERRGSVAAGEMPDEPMEMWTDIAEQLDEHEDAKEQKQAIAAAGEVEGYDEVAGRLRALCEEYGDVHGRVDFFEQWQVGEHSNSNSGKRPTGSGEGDEGLSSSQLSPSETRRTTSLATAADVRNKLDQFRQSVSAHLALVGRWKDDSKRKMVDELIAAVSDWKGSGGQRLKHRRQLADDGREGDETDTEDDEDDDEDEDEDEEEGEEEEENGNEDGDEEAHGEADPRLLKNQEESNDEVVADSQLDAT